jgi:CSLREA domain-containing protein
VQQSFRRLALLALIVWMSALLPAHHARAAGPFVVDALGDESDANPGDGVCRSTAGNCTLRAAVEQANASGGNTSITFSATGSIRLVQPDPNGIDSIKPIALTTNGITIDALGGGSVPRVEIRGEGLGGQGLLIKSSNNVIRGLAINGFARFIGSDDLGGAGIVISGANVAGANNNTIEKNYLGTNLTGTERGFSSIRTNNEFAGLLIIGGASNNTIRDNVISGNGGSGIRLREAQTTGGSAPIQSGNVIANNRIGTTPDGNTELENGVHGVLIGESSNNNTIGPGNIISGNGPATPNADTNYYGVYVFGTISTGGYISGNKIIGNRIGTNAAGTAAIPNTTGGVGVSSSAGTIVGGPGGDSNLIAGNRLYGVIIREERGTDRSVSGTNVQNNIIGINAAGTTALPNGESGVIVQERASGATITGNVIGGHPLAGVHINGTSGNTVKSNRIGTDSAGTGAVPNVNGILLDIGTAAAAATNNTIGGPSDADANIVTGNRQQGIIIRGNGSNGNKIERNRITQNGDNGVLIEQGAANNTVTRTATSGNGTGDGIRLSGGNGNLAAPTVSGLTVSGASPSQTLGGSISSSVNCSPNCTVEVFQSGAKEDGEGPFFLTAFQSNGNGPFSVTIPSCQPFLTFTITDGAGNTSPFSLSSGPISGCSGGPPPVGAEPELTPTTLTKDGAPGSAVTFDHTLRNKGTVAGNFTLAASGAPAGWNVSVTPTGAFSLGPGETRPVQMTVNIPAGVDAGPVVLRLTASAEGSAITSSADDTINVAAQAGVTLEPDVTLSGGPGQQLRYVHNLTNTGTGQDTFTITTAPPSGWTASVEGGPTFTLAKGETRQIAVLITIPTNPPPAPGNFTTTVTATSANNPQVADSVTDTTTVQAAAVPAISAAAAQNADPGATVTFSHTLTNVGNQNGSFDLQIIPPPGWTIVTSPTTPITLTQGASQQFSLAVRSPDTALAGPYGITARASTSGQSGITAQVVDEVNINRIPGLELRLDPANQPTLVKPDTTKVSTVVSYTFALTNTGNFTDDIALAAAVQEANVPLGWSARVDPPSVTLAARTSQRVTVGVIFRFGQPQGRSNETTLTASPAGGEPESATVTTTIDRAVGALFIPNEVRRSAFVTETAIFNFTLYNSGSIDQRYTLALFEPPAGWTSVITPTTTGVITPGGSISVQLALRAPPGTPDGTISRLTLRATPQDTGGTPGDGIARLRTGPPIDVLIEPDNQSTTLPGRLVQYTHLVTNTGRFSETINITAQSNLGWSTFVAPVSIQLGPEQTIPVSITVVVPAFASAGAVDKTTITARVARQPTVFDQVVNTTTVQQFAAVDISPNRTLPFERGKRVRFEHIVTNLGNGNDTFVISATADVNWTVSVTPSVTAALGRGISYPVDVEVQIPADADESALARFRIRATSKFDPAVTQEALDTIGSLRLQSPPGGSGRVYLPVIRR